MAGEPGRGPLPGPLGALASWVYGRVVASRNRRFDARRGVIEFDRPTISVGNLSVGGTGKTPFVQYLLGLLTRSGHSPCVAMRGYKGAGGDSDEASLYRRAFPQTPVVARADRVDGLIRLFATPEGERVDCIVLDDGFQHRRIARDVDFVLVDATRSPFDDALLPGGWLREPVENLARVREGGVVFTHAEGVGEGTLRVISGNLRAATGKEPIAVCHHTWSRLLVSDRGVEKQEEVEWLRCRPALAVCAIGNPVPFLARVEKATGVPLAGNVVLRDHDPYKEATVARVLGAAKEAGSNVIVTTEKDWTKLWRVDPDRWPCPVVRPKLALEFVRGREAIVASVHRAFEMHAAREGEE